MQRIIPNMILGYWLAFFAVHAAGQFGGLMFPMRSAATALFYANGLTIDVPMTNYGLGLASVIIAVLFAWALLTNAKPLVAPGAPSRMPTQPQECSPKSHRRGRSP